VLDGQQPHGVEVVRIDSGDDDLRDAGRASARVWLHPGNAPMTECGIFVVKYALQ